MKLLTTILCVAAALGGNGAYGYVRNTYGGRLVTRSKNVIFSVGPNVKAGLQNAAGKVVITPEADPVAALSAAMNTWNAVPGANLNLSLQQSDSDRPPTLDSTSVITFDDSDETRSIVGSAIAVTAYYVYASQAIIVDSDIVFNPDMTFASTPTYGAYDLQAIATHEIGHAIGASHTPLASATMFPYADLEDVSNRYLSNDEIAFVHDTYQRDGTFGGIQGSVKSASGSFETSALVLVINRDTGMSIAPYAQAGSYSTGGLPVGDYLVVAYPVAPAMANSSSSNFDAPDWQPAFYGGATPEVVTVEAGKVAQADITVPDGAAQFHIDYAMLGDLDTSFGSKMMSGSAVSVMLVGGGFATGMKPEDITVYGVGGTIQADSLVVLPSSHSSTSGAIAFTLNVPARTDWSDAVIAVHSADFSTAYAGIRVIPTQAMFAPSAVYNAASYDSGPVAPGEIVSIFGNNLGPVKGASSKPDMSGVLPASVSDTSVEFDGHAAPLFYVSEGQINVQVPFEVSGRTSTNVRVKYAGSSWDVVMPVGAASPGIFGTWDQPAIVNEDGSLNGGDHPVLAGHAIVIYGTGQGVVDPPLATGAMAPASPLSRSATVTATINKKDARVAFSGMAPGFVGLWQVNVIVPPDATAGYAELLLTVNGDTSRQAYADPFVKAAE